MPGNKLVFTKIETAKEDETNDTKKTEEKVEEKVEEKATLKMIKLSKRPEDYKTALEYVEKECVKWPKHYNFEIAFFNTVTAYYTWYASNDLPFPPSEEIKMMALSSILKHDECSHSRRIVNFLAFGKELK
eukprot:762025-Hanusia_phi.AAC.1